MRTALVCVAVLVIFSLGHSAQAQDGRQIFDFLAGQIGQEIEREQQRQFQAEEQRRVRQQQRDHNRAYKQLLPNWHACFGGDVAACDRALSSAILSFEDRQQLLAARAGTIERVRHEEAERERVAEQQRRAAAQAQRDAEVERSYARCQNFDAGGCEAVLASPHADTSQRTQVMGWKASAHDYETWHRECQNGSVSACDQALASPVATEPAQADLRRWRSAISPVNRLVALVAVGGSDASFGMPVLLLAIVIGLGATFA